MKKFWILWNPEGKAPPTKQFYTYEEAAKVAVAMQQRIGIGTMYVMEVKAGVSITLKQKFQIAR